MRIQKVYLETTIFNYYFDVEREAHPDTVRLFEEIAAGKYLAFTSTYVLDELSKAPEEKRNKMLSLIERSNVTVLDISDEAALLASIYVSEGIIPQRFFTDGVHIAMATVHDMDMILSLNFKHIVKKKTIELSEVVNVRQGYRRVQIYTPREVVDNE